MTMVLYVPNSFVLKDCEMIHQLWSSPELSTPYSYRSDRRLRLTLSNNPRAMRFTTIALPP